MTDVVDATSLPGDLDRQRVVLGMAQICAAGEGGPACTTDRLLECVRHYFSYDSAIYSPVDNPPPEWAPIIERIVAEGRASAANDASGRANLLFGIPVHTEGRITGVIILKKAGPGDAAPTDADQIILETAAGLIGQLQARIRAEAALAVLNQRYDLAVEGASAGVWDWDPVSVELFWSPTMRAMHGVGPDEIVSCESWRDGIHPDDVDGVLGTLQDHLTHRTEYNVEYRQVFPDGREVWLQTAGQAIWDEAGQPVRMAGSTYDISDRKAAEFKAAQRAELMQLAGHMTRMGYWHFPLPDGPPEWSDELYEMHVVTKSAFCPATDDPMQFIHPDDREAMRALDARTLESRSAVELEYRVILPDGEERNFQARSQCRCDAGGQPVALFGIYQDITALKQAEAALRRSEERYDYAIRGAGVGIWDWNAETGDRYWSADMRDILKVRDPDFQPTLNSFIDRLHPDDRQRVISLRQARIEDGGDFDSECRVRTDDDEYVWVRFRGQAFRDENGDLLRMAGSVYSIEERKRAERRDQESSRKLAVAGRAAKVGYFEIDLVTDAITLSDAIYEMYELDRDTYEPSLDDLTRITHPDDRELVIQAIDAARRTGETQSMSRRVIRTKTGDVRLVHSWIECFYDREGQPSRIFGVTQDVTEQREAEITLRHQAVELQRTNTELERFAFVASHDLQEPLRKVSAFWGMLSKRYAEQLDSDGQRMVGIMVDGATRMQHLIDDLLSYSKSSNAEMSVEAVDLNALLAQVRDELSVSLEESGGEIKLGTLPTVQGDVALLRQMFLNLVSNGLKYRGDSAPCVTVSAAQKDGDWIIEVADNGIGFPNEDAKAIFDMFKRLHGRGAYPGTGIGLALCQRIAERHRARIWAEGEPDKGARFFVAFPSGPRPD